MIALTVWEPWATLIALGVKRLETRRWTPPAHLWGRRIAIHAGARWTVGQKHAAEQLGAFPGQERLFGSILAEWCRKEISWEPPTLGHVLCTIELAGWAQIRPDNLHWLSMRHRVRPADDCEARGWEWACGDFCGGRFAWELIDPEIIAPPIAAKGKQGFWMWNT